MNQMYNLFRKVQGYRGKYKKIYSTNDWDKLNKRIDQELFQNGTRPEDVLVRRAGVENDILGDDSYGWD